MERIAIFGETKLVHKSLIFSIALIASAGLGTTTNAIELTLEKERCEALGFIPGTENFGSCVISLLKKRSSSSAPDEPIVPLPPQYVDIPQQPNSTYQQQMLEIERQRLAIERQKAEQQRNNALMRFGLGLMNSGQPRTSTQTNCTVDNHGTWRFGQYNPGNTSTVNCF